MRLLLIEPESAHVPVIERAAAEAGLRLERWPTLRTLPRDAALDEDTLLGVGPSVDVPLQAACVLQGLAPGYPLALFQDTVTSESAHNGRQPFMDSATSRWEVIRLGGPDELADALRGFAERAWQHRQHQHAVESMVRQLALASEEYLASVLAQANDAIVSTDPAGNVRTWNAAATRLFGCSVEDALERPFVALEGSQPRFARREDDGARSLAEVVALVTQTRRPEQTEVVWTRSDGAKVDLAVSVAPIRDAEGRFAGLSIIARNIMQRKRAEQALREANRQKDHFLAMMSHELRTPLTTILGYTDMLLRGLGGPLSPRGAHYLANVRTASMSLLGLVEGLLDYSQLEAGVAQLHVQELELEECVLRAIERVRPQAVPKNITIDTVGVNDVPAILADAGKVQQILGNYLTNAVKFTPEGGSIQVLARAEGERSPYVEIGVRDSGIGIPPEEIEQVWDRFYQVDSSSYTRQFGGLGLGLAIVRHLAALHGGRAWAESPGVGHGSTFWVALPAAPERPG